MTETPRVVTPELEHCRYLAFHMITGAMLARASVAQRAIDLAARQCGGSTDAIEVLDCGQEGRKIWLHNQSTAMPIFLSNARDRHVTVYRGPFYDDQSWHGSRRPAVPLAEG